VSARQRSLSSGSWRRSRARRRRARATGPCDRSSAYSQAIETTSTDSEIPLRVTERGADNGRSERLANDLRLARRGLVVPAQQVAPGLVT
jgi:hypothetical protein